MLRIPEDLLRIKLSNNGRQLIAMTPSGEKLPAIKSIKIDSTHGCLVTAEISILVNTQELSGLEFELKESSK